MSEEHDPKSYFIFNFIYEGKEVTLNFNKEDPTVTDVLDEVLNFMKACGYCFDVDDRLEVVNDFRHPSLNSEEFVDEREDAIRQMPDGSVKFVNPNWPNDWPDPEVTNFGWVEYDANGVPTHHTPYKQKDY